MSQANTGPDAVGSVLDFAGGLLDPPRMKRLLPLSWLVFALGCPAPTTDRPLDAGELEPETGPDGAVIRRFDLDGDGRPNIWRVFQGETPVRVDLDLNGDGKPDTRRTLDAAGEVAKEEADLDFDGKIDITANFEAGRKVQESAFLSHRATPDVLRLFIDGKLAEKRRDLDGNGVFEVFEFYEGGRLVRLGRDTTGDGQPDEFDERPDNDSLPEEEKG